MGKTVLKIVIYLVLCAVLPYGVTTIMSGGGKKDQTAPKTVASTDNMSQEDYLIGTVGAYYKAEDSPEFLRVMVILANTCKKYFEANPTGCDSAHPALAYCHRDELRTLWGKDYSKNLKAVAEAVRHSQSAYLAYEGKVVYPYFHTLSSGMTRNGCEEYLRSCDSSDDIHSPCYINTMELSEENTKEILAKNFEGLEFDGQVSDSFQIIERDNAGYVAEVMVGGVTLSGDEVCRVLGLASGDFTVNKGVEGVIFTSKGIGSGYGISIEGARAKAAAGYGAEEIFSHYYKKLEIINE